MTAQLPATIVVVGTNHERAPLELRERIAIRDDLLPAALAARPATLQELAVLSTCNRTECYAVAAEPETGVSALRGHLAALAGVPADTIAAITYAHAGQAAVRHLFAVASGLDSMVLGEPHILGQVRDAFAAAADHAAAGPLLARLGTDALRVGKRVRTLTGLARHRLSIPHAAVDLATRDGPNPTTLSAAVIGAGEMGALTARLLRGARIGELIVLNRSEARGRALADRVGGSFAPLSALPAIASSVDLLFAAVATPEPLITRPTLRDRPTPARSLTIVDLGVPRTVDPAVAELPAVALYDVDDLEACSLGRRAQSTQDVAAAERIAAAAAVAFLAWLSERDAVPTIAALRDHAETIRRAELDRALRKLDHLTERDRNVVAALSVGIVNKLLHAPTTRLKSDPDAGTAMTLRRLFALHTAATTPPVDGPPQADEPAPKPATEPAHDPVVAVERPALRENGPEA